MLMNTSSVKLSLHLRNFLIAFYYLMLYVDFPFAIGKFTSHITYFLEMGELTCQCPNWTIQFYELKSRFQCKINHEWSYVCSQH